MIAYYNGAYLPEEQIRVSPTDRGYMFADGVYEVVRSYAGLLFRLDEHMKRLDRSLQSVRITSDRLEQIPEIFRELLARNDMEERDAILYVQVTRGAFRRTHAFPLEQVVPNVYAQASELNVNREQAVSGVPVILVGDTRWSRCDIKSIALLPNVLAAEEARERGAHEALFVRDGMVIEGSRSNFAGIRSGALVTPPKSNYMLSGVSRDLVIELCGRIGIPVEQRPIPECELPQFDELILIGTSIEVLPIVSVDGKRVADGIAGTVTRRLQRAFREAVEEARPSLRRRDAVV